MPTLEERVQAGAEYLDEIRPGWEEEVNTDHLQLNNCLDCVLGQLFGDFDEALAELDITEGDAKSMGFLLSEFRNFEEEDYPELTDIWRDLIKKRRNK